MAQFGEYINSYYQVTGRSIPLQPALNEEVTVDVCIIGGGMTGFRPQRWAVSGGVLSGFARGG